MKNQGDAEKNSSGESVESPRPALKSGFTPGPWFNNAGISIDSQKNGGTIVWLDDDTSDANARLIAAAPALYEALDKVLQCFANGTTPHNDIIQEGRAARALVNGQAPSARNGDSEG